MLLITKEKKERFRTIQPQIFYLIPGVDIFDYEVDGYLQGERVDKLKGLTIAHYDQIQIIRKSTNTNKGGEFLHGIGWRKKENQYTCLVLKKKH